MDNICFSLIIRDKTCQSGVPIISEKVYTNLSSNESIVLQNGYMLNVFSTKDNKIKLEFINLALDISVNYYILSDSFGIFDLPIDSGTYRVGVYATKTCCSCIGG